MLEPSTVDPRSLWTLCVENLRRLRTEYGFAASAAGGLYHTLFGRDSLWMLLLLLEALSLVKLPNLTAWVEAAGVDLLNALARLQGVTVDDSIEEQPGKILHEFRPIPDARLQAMGLVFRDGRSYSGFDQTFLFVTAYRRFAERQASARLSPEVWPAIEKALEWILRDADEDGDGLFEYSRRDRRNLLNQVWKDSFDSAVQTGMDVPPHPLAWIDIQGYGYRALLDGAHLYRLRGAAAPAARLEERAAVLKRRVHEAFWIPGEECFAMALDADKKPLTMVTSNAGHALWGGLATSDAADRIVSRLLRPDLTTPYGIRTLSASSPFYAPFSYHRGTIWPFDNAICVQGLLSYGYRREALDIARGVGAVIVLIGLPHELYVVLDPDLFLHPRLPTPGAILTRQASMENRVQGWTVAALAYFGAVLGVETGLTLPDFPDGSAGETV